MQTVLRYPGSKGKLTPWINSYIPKHKIYIDAFFGGGSIFFSKLPSQIEIINDIDRNVTTAYKVLRDKPDELIRAIELTPYSRDEYDLSYKIETNLDEVERARRFFVRCWQGYGSSNLYHNGFKTTLQEIRNPAKSWANLPPNLERAAKRLSGVQVERCDALSLIQRFKFRDAFIYVDPTPLPGLRKGYFYQEEMDETQHIKLLEALKDHPGPVMISSYDNDLYDEILDDWYKIYFDPSEEVPNDGPKDPDKLVEVLWLNYDPDTANRASLKALKKKKKKMSPVKNTKNSNQLNLFELMEPLEKK